MAVVGHLEHADADDAAIELRVPTMVDGIASAFDLFGIQSQQYRRLYVRPPSKPQQDALAQAWINLGMTMSAAMALLTSEPADEQR